MCISGLARNINDWKLTGRKKKEVMKTTSHSEHHQWCRHIFHSSCIRWWLTTYVVFSSFIRAAVQCIDRSRALSWYGLLMSFPVAGLGLVPLLISWLCASISVSRTHPNHVKGYRMLWKSMQMKIRDSPFDNTNYQPYGRFIIHLRNSSIQGHYFQIPLLQIWTQIQICLKEYLMKGAITTQYVLVPLWVM